MQNELIYTSIPRGLLPNTYGYCIAAATEDISPVLSRELRSLSDYNHLFELSDSRYAQNPVNFAHTILRGGTLHVLSRISAAPPDYSGRVNFIAHHFAFDSIPSGSGGPAECLLGLQDQFLKQYDGEAKYLPAPNIAFPQAPLRLDSWRKLGLDAGLAGLLAGTAMRHPAKPSFLIYPPNQDILPLLADAMSLLPPEKRWDVTFSTYYLPSIHQNYTWRGIAADSPTIAELSKYPDALVIDLTRPASLTASGPDAEAARAGKPLQPNAAAPDADPEAADSVQNKTRSRLRMAEAAEEEGAYAILASEDEPGRPATTLPRLVQAKRKKGPHTGLILAILGLLAIGVGAVLFFLLRHPPEPIIITPQSQPASATPSNNIPSPTKPSFILTAEERQTLSRKRDELVAQQRKYQRHPFSKTHPDWKKKTAARLGTDAQIDAIDSKEKLNAFRENLDQAGDLLDRVRTSVHQLKRLEEMENELKAAVARLEKLAGFAKNDGDFQHLLGLQKKASSQKGEEQYRSAAETLKQALGLAGKDGKLYAHFSTSAASRPSTGSTTPPAAATTKSHYPVLRLSKDSDISKFRAFSKRMVLEHAPVDRKAWDALAFKHDFLIDHPIEKALFPKNVNPRLFVFRFHIPNIKPDQELYFLPDTTAKNATFKYKAAPPMVIAILDRKFGVKQDAMLIFREKDKANVYLALSPANAVGDGNREILKELRHVIVDPAGKTLYWCCPRLKLQRTPVRFQKNEPLSVGLDLDEEAHSLAFRRRGGAEEKGTDDVAISSARTPKTKLEIKTPPGGKKLVVNVSAAGLSGRKTFSELLTELRTGKHSNEEVIDALGLLAEIDGGQIIARNKGGAELATCPVHVGAFGDPGDDSSLPFIITPLKAEKKGYAARIPLPPGLSKAQVKLRYAPPVPLQANRRQVKRGDKTVWERYQPAPRKGENGEWIFPIRYLGDCRYQIKTENQKSYLDVHLDIKPSGPLAGITSEGGAAKQLQKQYETHKQKWDAAQKTLEQANAARRQARRDALDAAKNSKDGNEEIARKAEQAGNEAFGKNKGPQARQAIWRHRYGCEISDAVNTLFDPERMLAKPKNGTASALRVGSRNSLKNKQMILEFIIKKGEKKYLRVLLDGEQP